MQLPNVTIPGGSILCLLSFRLNELVLIFRRLRSLPRHMLFCESPFPESLAGAKLTQPKDTPG